MKHVLIAATFVFVPAVLSASAQAQGTIPGAERGAAAGDRAAGPVGGVVGAATGTVGGVLGVPDRRDEHVERREERTTTTVREHNRY